MNRKVLIVDDEDNLRTLTAQWFERLGYTVFTADNGLEGIELAETHIPDLVVLDLMMPGVHGFEVCKRLRSNQDLSRTVIIVTSAKSYKPDIDKATELGADSYMVKPVDYDELTKVALDFINKRTKAT